VFLHDLHGRFKDYLMIKRNTEVTFRGGRGFLRGGTSMFLENVRFVKSFSKIMKAYSCLISNSW